MGRLLFGDFVLDLDAFELRCGDVARHVEPQVFAVLTYLAQHPERVVAKEELLDAVWGDRFVSESAMTSRIRAARAAVDDNGKDQRMIRTVHGRGYRFACPVTSDEGPATPAAVDERDGGNGVVLRPDPWRPRMLERESELAAIGSFVGELRSRGRGGVVCISGGAGLGKTTLVRALADSVAQPVLVGGCEDLTTPRPLAPFRDMLAADGTPLLPRDAVVADPTSALDALVRLAAESRPPVVVVEDAHWADDASVDLLRILIRHAASIPALVVITYRDDDIAPGHPMRRLLGSLRQPMVHLRLEPLSLAAIGELGVGPGLAPQQILDVTGGNPFFVSEIIANPGHAVPASVRDAVLARIDGMASSVQVALQALSVVPARVERSLAADVLPDASAVLVEAERCGLLAGDATTVWFRHELARRAIEAELTAGERIAHNLAIARALVAEGGDPARVVHHALQAADDQLVAEHGLEAGVRAAAAGAHRQALAHLDAFLAAVDPTDDRRIAEALLQRTHSLYLINRFAESLRAAEDGVARWTALGDDGCLARALAGLARTSLWAVGPRAAEVAAAQALAAATRASASDELLASIHAELARARGNLATLGPISEPNAAAIEDARVAVRFAEATGRPDAISHALTYLGAERLSGHDPGGAADVERALALARSDPRIEYVGRTCVNASGAMYRTGALDDALRYVTDGLDACADGEFFAGEYRLRLTRAAVLCSIGRWSDAEAELRELVDLPGEPGIMRPLALSILARLLARQGAADAAEVEDAAIGAVKGSDEPHAVGPVAVAVAERHWLEGVPPPTFVLDALALARRRQHRVTEAELRCYLARMGIDVDPPGVQLPGPWADALAADHQGAAASWAGHGERYEQAIEEWLCGERATALDRLRSLGATATIGVLRRRA